MKPIDHDDVSEHKPHTFFTDASSLGLKPGEWPNSIPTKLGNGLPFLISFHSGDEVHYAQQFGCLKLIVAND